MRTPANFLLAFTSTMLAASAYRLGAWGFLCLIVAGVMNGYFYAKAGDPTR